MYPIESFWIEIQPFLAAIGFGGLTIAGAVAAAFGLFKWMGTKWVDQHFARELERSKNEHQQELERLKHRINSMFDRTTRLHTREFEVLPELWGRLVDAYNVSSAYLNPFQSYANVSRMREDELEELLEKSPFSEPQKRDVRESQNKFDTYRKLIAFYKYREAATKLQECDNHFRRNGIFVQSELQIGIERMINLIWDAVSEQHINDAGDMRPLKRDDARKLTEDGKPLFASLEKAVRDRLWDSTKIEV